MKLDTFGVLSVHMSSHDFRQRGWTGHDAIGNIGSKYPAYRLFHALVEELSDLQNKKQAKFRNLQSQQRHSHRVQDSAAAYSKK